MSPAEWFGVIRRASDKAPNDAEHDQPKDSHADGLVEEQDFRTQMRRVARSDAHTPSGRAIKMSAAISQWTRADRDRKPPIVRGGGNAFMRLEPGERLRAILARESDNLKADS